MELRTKPIESAFTHAAQVVGLSKPFRPEIVRGCAAEAGSTSLFEYCPGNGTRYVVMVANISGFGVALEMLGTSGRCFQISLLNGGSGKTMTCGASDFLHYRYLQEKLVVGLADSVVLAEMIGFVCGLGAISCADFLSTTRG